jgi:dTDP-4-dehydrorhamnose 3,5-epimerase
VPDKAQLVSKSVSSRFYTQSYSAKSFIDGVKILELKSFPGDDSDFGEVLRLTSSGHVEVLPDFHLRQINRTELFPGSQKGWHVHANQDELWYVSPKHALFVGLWDVRRGSSTEGVTMRINLGFCASRMLFIPRGVAHGVANFSGRSAELWYFVNNQFNPDDPDEGRLPWDACGREFWSPERD